MCFITNGDLVLNQKIIYKKIKEIESRQAKFISVLNNILNLLTNQQKVQSEEIQEEAEANENNA